MNLLKKELNTILSKFGVTNLSLPLFHAHKYGIRFELGMYAETHEKYIDDLLVRANTLYEAVFEPDAEILVVLFRSFWGTEKHRRIRAGSYLMRCIYEKRQVYFKKDIKKLYIYGDDDPDDRYCMAVIKSKGPQADHRKIFRAIAEREYSLPHKISIQGWNVVFIHPEKSIMLYMYDDRGLDIVAAEKGMLLTLYHRFNSWILDYDRKKIMQSLGINS